MAEPPFVKPVRIANSNGVLVGGELAIKLPPELVATDYPTGTVGAGGQITGYVGLAFAGTPATFAIVNAALAVADAPIDINNADLSGIDALGVRTIAASSYVEIGGYLTVGGALFHGASSGSGDMNVGPTWTLYMCGDGSSNATIPGIGWNAVAGTFALGNDAASTTITTTLRSRDVTALYSGGSAIFEVLRSNKIREYGAGSGVVRLGAITQGYGTTSMTLSPASTSIFSGQDNLDTNPSYAKVADLEALRQDLMQAIAVMNTQINYWKARGTYT